jgi:hypothetical protein
MAAVKGLSRAGQWRATDDGSGAASERVTEPQPVALSEGRLGAPAYSAVQTDGQAFQALLGKSRP